MRKVDQIKNDECFPCCVAMVLDRSRRSVPYFDPWSQDWRKQWEDWFDAEGIERLTYPPLALKLRAPQDAWIATVPGYSGLMHAVVMHGDKLFHDPYRWSPRKRRPRRIYRGLELYA